ncbi:MAG: recombinase [Bacteroidetes bacterium]|jgi:site-specific recombinase|nr:recombinase [Bacteroidota bacterium]
MSGRKTLVEILEGILRHEGSDPGFLAELVDYIRPKSSNQSKTSFERLDEFILYLKQEPKYRVALSEYIKRVLAKRKISRFLIDADIVYGTDFFYEIRKRLTYKFLPYQAEENSIEYILNLLFYKKKDSDWIQNIPNSKGEELVDLLELPDLSSLKANDFLIEEILFSLQVLSHRMIGHAFSSDVLSMVPEYENFESPFIAMQECMDQYLADIRQKETSRRYDEESYKHLLVLINQCEDYLRQAYKNRKKYGLSQRMHQHLMTIERMLQRIREILSFLIIFPEEEVISDNIKGNPKQKGLFELVQWMVKRNSRHRQLRGYIIKSTQLIAQEITQHTGTKGEKYITHDKQGFYKMFKTACGGGAIVGLACVIKLLLSKLDVSLFGQAFLYSLNYAFAFIAIYLFHLTLATKQPAMTAATLAATIKSDLESKDKFAKVIQISIRAFRSQFIAFVGNVVVSFPVAIILIAALSQYVGDNLAYEKTDILLYELDPLRSPAVLHATIAGFFLFISGLIAGQAANRTLYNRIPPRIEKHPLLRRLFSKVNRKKIAAYYQRNIGGISSNLWFGIFMGTTSTVGIILGLPLDIRHIAFSAGNFGLGLFGNSFSMSFPVLFWSLMGISLIGFLNFIVSFGLSLILALQAREVPLSRLKTILIGLGRSFLQDPIRFFWPKKEAEPIEGIEKDDLKV